ncbi:MAG TPA: S8 family serine peptidase [Jatrophihabitans sp.]|nr:S8 family serine peptidase [Jatrophihabitans sp.]
MTGRRRGRRLLLASVALLALAVPTLMPAAPAVAAPGPSEAPEWWFDSWQVPTLWGGGADGHGITIAVIDTGVQASVPELSGKVLPGADFIGNGTDGRTDFDAEGFSHGTAMASIMVARPGLGNIEGLAPNAQILPISVPLHGVVSHGTPTPNATSTAINWAADHGAKIISMSLGGVRDEEEDGPDPCPAGVQQAVLHALRKGALVVAASGNSGDANSPVEEPGVCLGVVSVGAVDRNLDVASFSSRHPYLTLSAPGEAIPTLSRDSAYIGDGTSQATAMTSAALAMVWSKYPTETGRQILTRVLDTATDRGPKGRDAAYGVGVINPEAAISAGVPAATAANEVFDGVAPLLASHTTTSTLKPAKLPAITRQFPGGDYRVSADSGAPPSRVVLLGALAVALLALAVVALVVALRPARAPSAQTVPGWTGPQWP